MSNATIVKLFAQLVNALGRGGLNILSISGANAL
jgi:hypothetical protein